MCSIRVFAQLIGKLVASQPGFTLAPLYYKDLEKEKTEWLNLKKGNFDSVVKLSEKTREIILWWLKNVDKTFRKIIVPKPEYVLFSDSSDFEEKNKHINEKE